MMFKRNVCRGLLWILVAALHGQLAANGFVVGTLVKVPGGYAPIETISVGDSVYCCDLQGNLVERPVAATVRCPAVQTCVVVQLGNDTELRTSPQQQFFVRDIAWRHKNAWMAAGSLSQEQRLLSKADIGECEIKDIWRIEMPTGGGSENKAEFYDLMIDLEHNYLVTEHDLIAHNVNVFDIIVNVGSFVPYCLFKGIEKVAKVAVVAAKRSTVLLEQLLSHIDTVPIIGIFFDPEATVGKLAIRVIAKEAVLNAFGKAAVVEVVERFHPGSTKGFHIHVDNKWYAITGEHAGTGNWFEGNCDSYGNRIYTQRELWEQQQYQAIILKLQELNEPQAWHIGFNIQEEMWKLQRYHDQQEEDQQYQQQHIDFNTHPELWEQWKEAWEREEWRKVKLYNKVDYSCPGFAEAEKQRDDAYKYLKERKTHLAKRSVEARQAREVAEKARQGHLQSLSLEKQKMLQRVDAEMAEFNRTFCPDPLSIDFYYRSNLAVTPDVTNVWKQRTSVLELTAQNMFRQQLAATLPAEALGMPEVQERIKPLPRQQYDLFLSREPEFVAFLKENGFNLADFTLAGASPTQARVCFEVEALLHGLYEQKKFSLLPGHHNPDLLTICNFANTALQKNKFYQPGNVPVSFPLIDLGNAIASQRVLYPTPEIKAATSKTTVQQVSRYVAETTKQIVGGTKAIVQSPKALGNLALDVGLLACPLTTNLGLMKITLDVLNDRNAVNAQLAQLNDNLRNDPILGLSQVSAGVIGAMVMHKAVGATQSLLCETRQILSGIGAGLYEEMTAASRSPYTPQGPILDMVETIDGTWALASKYGPKVVAEGIRNLEVAAHAGKLTVAPSINHLATAIDRSCSTATAIKTLPETLGKFAVNNTIHFPACATWLDVSSTIKHFAGAVDSAKLTKLTPDKVEFVAQDNHSKWIVRAEPHPYDFTKRPGIKPLPGLAPTDKYIVQAELQQFDSRKNKFITVRHGHMEVEHNLGFEDFAQDMVDTFGVPRTKTSPILSSRALTRDLPPSGAEAALAEIKKGSGESQQPIFGDNVDVSEAILERVAAAAALAPTVPAAELEAAVEEITKAIEPTISQQSHQQPVPLVLSIPTAPSNAVTVIQKGPISHVETNLPKPITIEETHAFIAKEFELGMQHMINTNDDFSYTSTIALSANEAETTALKVLETILDNGSGFVLKQANKHRVEIVQVVHENGLVRTITMRYRYPLPKQSGAQKGAKAGNLEYEVQYKGGSVGIQDAICANLHILIH